MKNVFKNVIVSNKQQRTPITTRSTISWNRTKNWNSARLSRTSNEIVVLFVSHPMIKPSEAPPPLLRNHVSYVRSLWFSCPLLQGFQTVPDLSEATPPCCLSMSDRYQPRAFHGPEWRRSEVGIRTHLYDFLFLRRSWQNRQQNKLKEILKKPFSCYQRVMHNCRSVSCQFSATDFEEEKSSPLWHIWTWTNFQLNDLTWRHH